MSVRAVGEFRGRQALHSKQSPEVLETLRRVAMVQSAEDRLVGRFTIGDLQRACPGVSYPTLQRALADLKRERKVRCLGRGPDAQWERITRE
jgi:hypothetical protein